MENKYLMPVIILILVGVIAYQYTTRPDNTSIRVNDQIALTEDYKLRLVVSDSLLAESKKLLKELARESNKYRSSNQKLSTEKRIVEAERDSLRAQRLRFKDNYKPKNRTNEELDHLLSDFIDSFRNY